MATPYNPGESSGPPRRPDVKRKLVVVGDGTRAHLLAQPRLRGPSILWLTLRSPGGCGKTCLLIVYAENRFPEVCTPSYGNTSSRTQGLRLTPRGLLKGVHSNRVRELRHTGQL